MGDPAWQDLPSVSPAVLTSWPEMKLEDPPGSSLPALPPTPPETAASAAGYAARSLYSSPSSSLTAGLGGSSEVVAASPATLYGAPPSLLPGGSAEALAKTLGLAGSIPSSAPYYTSPLHLAPVSIPTLAQSAAFQGAAPFVPFSAPPASPGAYALPGLPASYARNAAYANPQAPLFDLGTTPQAPYRATAGNSPGFAASGSSPGAIFVADRLYGGVDPRTSLQPGAYAHGGYGGTEGAVHLGFAEANPSPASYVKQESALHCDGGAEASRYAGLGAYGIPPSPPRRLGPPPPSPPRLPRASAALSDAGHPCSSEDRPASSDSTGPSAGGGTKSQYRGVSYDRKKGKWRVQIKVAALGKSGVSVGYYDTELAAARAYDRAAIGLLGRGHQNLQTNFELNDYAGESIPRLTGKTREEVKSTLKSERLRAAPRRRFSSRARTSRFMGVGSSNRKNQWQARILVHGKVTHLGYYDGEEAAARVYDRVALALHGPGAQTNFGADQYLPEELAPFANLDRESLQRALGVKPMDKSSRFRGVSRKKGRWEAKVMVNRRWAYRELFDSEEEAARAYDAALWRLKPRDALSYANFKDQLPFGEQGVDGVPAHLVEDDDDEEDELDEDGYASDATDASGRHQRLGAQSGAGSTRASARAMGRRVESAPNLQAFSDLAASRNPGPVFNLRASISPLDRGDGAQEGSGLSSQHSGPGGAEETSPQNSGGRPPRIPERAGRTAAMPPRAPRSARADRPARERSPAPPLVLGKRSVGGLARAASEPEFRTLVQREPPALDTLPLDFIPDAELLGFDLQAEFQGHSAAAAAAANALNSPMESLDLVDFMADVPDVGLHMDGGIRPTRRSRLAPGGAPPPAEAVVSPRAVMPPRKISKSVSVINLTSALLGVKDALLTGEAPAEVGLGTPNQSLRRSSTFGAGLAGLAGLEQGGEALETAASFVARMSVGVDGLAASLFDTPADDSLQLLASPF